jgi:hypothetical protein
MAHASDDGIDFVAGELSTFAGLGALRHLDLQFLSADKILARDAETS